MQVLKCRTCGKNHVAYEGGRLEAARQAGYVTDGISLYCSSVCLDAASEQRRQATPHGRPTVSEQGNTERNGRKVINKLRLTRKQERALEDWMHDNREGLESVPTTALEIAKRAGAAMGGLPLTEHHVKSACEVTGVKYKRAGGGSVAGGVHTATLICRQLVALSDALGVPLVDERLRQIASKGEKQ